MRSRKAIVERFCSHSHTSDVQIRSSGDPIRPGFLSHQAETLSPR